MLNLIAIDLLLGHSVECEVANLLNILKQIAEPFMLLY